MPASTRRRLVAAVAPIPVLTVLAAGLVATPEAPVHADSPVISGTVRTVEARSGTLPDVDDGGVSRTLVFGTGEDQRLDSVATAHGQLREVAATSDVRARRVPDACTHGETETVWFGPYDARAGAVAVSGSFTPSMAQALTDPSLGDGVDNALTNDPRAASCNDVERLDLLHRPSLVVSPSEDGYLLLERGGNDAFGIAAVTGVDGRGDPTSVGPLLAAPASGWGPLGAAGLTSVVLRHDGPSERWRLTGRLAPQPLAGRFVSAADLGLSAGETVYGVVVVASDVVAGTDLLAPDAFPRDTSEASGGLDLIGSTLMTSRPRDETPRRSAVALAGHAVVDDSDGDGVDAGDRVTTTFVVTNAGEATLQHVAVDAGSGRAVTCARSSLEPGRSTECTSTPYDLSQHDLDVGLVETAAVVRARSGAGGSESPVTAAATVRLTLPQHPAMSVGRHLDHDAGHVVYRFTLRNTGNVTLTGLGVRVGPSGETGCPIRQLAPGLSTTCLAVRGGASRERAARRPTSEADAGEEVRGHGRGRMP